MATSNDPTDPIRLKASRYAAVDAGTSCTQTSFKTGKKAFLYVGMQGGRYKAMFKLGKSLAEATRLAGKEPDRYEIGTPPWVTARFSADQPLPRKLWEKWLDESYARSLPSGAAAGSGKKKTSKTASAGKRGAGKPTPRKAAARKKPAKKKVARR